MATTAAAESTPVAEAADRPILATQPITPPPGIRWCTIKDVYYCRIVSETQMPNRYSKKGLVMTPNELFICDEKTGAVERVVCLRKITKCYQQVVEVSRKMGFSKEQELHTLLVIPQELDLLVSQHADSRNGPKSDANELVNVLRELMRCLGVTLPVTTLEATDKIYSFANFNPSDGYVDTQTQLQKLYGKKHGETQRTHRYSRLQPVQFRNAAGRVEMLKITETGQLCWSCGGDTLLPSVASLSFNGTNLEAPGTGISSVVSEILGDVSRTEFLRMIGLLAAYSNTKTNGLPVPMKKVGSNNQSETLVTREGETFVVPIGSGLQVLYAEYGMEGSGVTHVTDIVRSHVADGGITMPVTSDVLGTDPCPGQAKVLTVTCMRKMPQPSAPPQLSPQPPQASANSLAGSKLPLPSSDPRPRNGSSHSAAGVAAPPPQSPAVAAAAAAAGDEHNDPGFDAYSVPSTASVGSRTYRHDPYASDADCDNASVGSSVSSYAYTLPRAGRVAGQRGADDMQSPTQLSSSMDSCTGLPSLMQTNSDGSCLSRRSSLHSQQHWQHGTMGQMGASPPRPPIRGESASSVPSTSEPPLLLETSTGHVDSLMGIGSQASNFSECNIMRVESLPDGQWQQILTQHNHPHQQPFPQAQPHAQQAGTPQMGTPQQVPMQPPMQYPMMPQQQQQQQQQQQPQQAQPPQQFTPGQMPLQPPGMQQQQQMYQQQQQQQQQQQPQMPLQPGMAPAPVPQSQSPQPPAQAAPRMTAPSKGFVEFTDTDGDVVRFQEVGKTICLSVNQQVFGYLRSLDYDHKTGKLVDGTGGWCTLPPTRMKGLESRLAWLAEQAGVSHNIKSDAPMVFEIKLENPTQPLGMSFEVIDDGSVRVSGVQPDTPCGLAGVVCGTILLLDKQPVRSGNDLRRIVTEIRAQQRTEFVLEVKKKPKEEVAAAPPTISANAAQRHQQLAAKGAKGAAKGAAAKGARGQAPQSDALVRLFVLFKHGRRAEYASNERVSAGGHVLVESREGVDLGLVAGARLGGRKDDRYRVQRKALPEEVEQWKSTVAAEEANLQLAKQYAKAMQTPVELHRCEIQFDKRKITFHFSGQATKQQLSALSQTCTQKFGIRAAFNNCMPPTGERGDPIDLSSPSIPSL